MFSVLSTGIYSLVLIVHVCLCVCWQNGQTPLMLAAEQGSLEIVQELVRRGANVNLDDVVSGVQSTLLLTLYQHVYNNTTR